MGSFSKRYNMTRIICFLILFSSLTICQGKHTGKYPGFYRQGRQNLNNPCDPADAGIADCDPAQRLFCDPAPAAPAVANTCQACGAGEITDGANNAACEACPNAGEVPDPANADACIACVAQIPSADGTVCEDCPNAGEVPDPANADACIACVGQIQSADGSVC